MHSVLDAVLEHAQENPEKTCVTLYSAREAQAQRSFGEVAARAKRAAAAYHARGVKRGDIVVLIGTHHLDFYSAWLGAVWLGAVPTVLAEPSVRIDRGLYWSRLGALLLRIEARLLAIDPRIRLEPGALGGLEALFYDGLAAGDEGGAPPRCPSQESDLLLLQHSSGTTGLQKGVMLSHGAVMRHARSYLGALGTRAGDVVATWLPLYHDMGLIACFVIPLVAGIPVVWLSPFEWVANPSLLLRAVTEHKATLVWLPNFAYSFLSTRVRETDGLDLSSLRAVINCSEPVGAQAMDAFAERFARVGLDPASLHACYAMAENVFAVSASTPASPPRRIRLDPCVWRDEHRVAKVEAGGAVHISNGPCVEGCEVRIADDAGRPRPPLSAGRILIRSPFLFDGYFKSLPEGRLFDDDGFYDTGDLGYLDPEGHVYVTGRKKDLVIVGGRNVYPQDVEQVVMEAAPVHEGRVVCFGVPVKGAGTEGLVVLAETDTEEGGWPDVVRAMRRAVPTHLDLDLADARVAARGTLRKSTSGKLSRSGNREWYLEGRFGPPPPSVEREEES